jgi:hypothetical protein
MAKFAFPYPVLGSGSSVEGDFDVTIDISRNEAGSVIFQTHNVNIGNEEVKDLYNKSICRIVLRIYCASTFYSDSLDCSEDQLVTIEEDKLINRCEAEVLLVLNEDLEYSLESFSEDYKGLSFQLKKNDVLGVTSILRWDVPRSYEKLASNSIFKWTMRSEDSDMKEIVSFNFDNDEIHITYPFNNDIDPASALFRKNVNTAYWSFIVPALTEGYRKILSDDDVERSEYQNYRWFHYLEQVMNIRSLESPDPFELAQKVFIEGSFIKMFKELSQ